MGALNVQNYAANLSSRINALYVINRSQKMRNYNGFRNILRKFLNETEKQWRLCIVNSLPWPFDVDPIEINVAGTF